MSVNMTPINFVHLSMNIAIYRVVSVKREKKKKKQFHILYDNSRIIVMLSSSVFSLSYRIFLTISLGVRNQTHFLLRNIVNFCEYVFMCQENYIFDVYHSL